jgi:phosphoribosylformylglycinamidine (FGAM) synthase PurS component
MITTTYHLTSSDELTQEIFDSIKSTYKSKSFTITVEEDEDFEYSDEVIKMLEHRINDPNAKYITADESIKAIKDKYGI